MQRLSEFIIEMIRFNPGIFFIVCTGIALVLIFLSHPGAVAKLAALLSLCATGVFIILRQLFSLLAAVENMIVGLFKSTFEQLQRLIK